MCLSSSDQNKNCVLKTDNNNNNNENNNKIFHQLQSTYKDVINFGPIEFYYMKLAFESIQSNAGVPMIFSYLRLADWDPETYVIFHPKLKVIHLLYNTQ